jgi:hypothetical protein
MKDEAGLGLAIIFCSASPDFGYEDNCPLKPVKTGEYSVNADN